MEEKNNEKLLLLDSLLDMDVIQFKI